MIKVLLLAAGLGTRLKPLTDRMPKCLIPINGRPLLDYWFDRFDHAGIRHVMVNTHGFREEVLRYIEGRNQSGYFVEESFEPKLLGSAGAIHANRDFMDDADICLVIYADNLSAVDLDKLVRVHCSYSTPLTITLFRVSCPEECGIVELDPHGRVLSFTEKPSSPKGNLANAGVYAMTRAAFRRIADMDRFDLGFDVFPSFIGSSSSDMCGWVWDGYHVDIGTFKKLDCAQSDALTGVYDA